MSAIYEPRGKAGEYSPLALNLYKGCSHACKYCYAPSATFTQRDRFSSSEYIRLRPNIMNQLEKDVKKFANDDRDCLLSFTSDAYQELEKQNGATREAVKLLTKNNIKHTVLTKSGTWGIERDSDLFCPDLTTWAVTLTCDNPSDSFLWEPGAAAPYDRVESLCIAKELGLKTWVSFEPVVDPNQALNMIEFSSPWTDFYKIGKLNYNQHSKNIDWHKFLHNAESMLKKLGKPYMIKDDLEKFR